MVPDGSSPRGVFSSTSPLVSGIIARHAPGKSCPTSDYGSCSYTSSTRHLSAWIVCAVADLSLFQGYSVDDPNIELLRLRNFTAGHRLTEEQVLGPKLVTDIMTLIGSLQPLVSLVSCQHLSNPENSHTHNYCKKKRRTSCSGNGCQQHPTCGRSAICSERKAQLFTSLS